MKNIIGLLLIDSLLSGCGTVTKIDGWLGDHPNITQTSKDGLNIVLRLVADNNPDYAEHILNLNEVVQNYETKKGVEISALELRDLTVNHFKAKYDDKLANILIDSVKDEMTTVSETTSGNNSLLAETAKLL